jgi:hypothetical protein
VTGYPFPISESGKRLPPILYMATLSVRIESRGLVFPTFVQGCYYASSGVWPLISIDTFQRVTGPKTDLWLVRTVGILVTVIGVVLILSWWRRRTALEIAVLGTGTAAALAGIDVYYVARRVLSPIYLADALAETSLIACWVFRLTRRL